MSDRNLCRADCVPTLTQIVQTPSVRTLLIDLYRGRPVSREMVGYASPLIQYGLIEGKDRVRLTREGRVVAYNLHEWDIQVAQRGIFPFLERLGITRDSVVVDIGCGGGQTLIACRQIAPCRVIGIDRDRTALYLARAWMQATGVPEGEYSLGVADIHRIPLPSSFCTHVICRVVLQKLLVKHAVSEIARILRPGGCLFLHVLGAGYYLQVASRGIRDLCVSSFALANGVVFLATGSQLSIRWRGKTLREVFLTTDRTVRLLRARGLRVREKITLRFLGIASSLILTAVKQPEVEEVA